MTRKKKIPFAIIAGMGYYKYVRTNLDGMKGVLFFMEKLSDEQKRQVLQYNNTRLYISKKQYAPEIKSNCVFMADKCY